MGYVKTADELKEIRQALFPSNYEFDAVFMEFETDPEFLREVLPPCFEPGEPAVAVAGVGAFKSARQQFKVAIIDIPARRGDREGAYDLFHILDRDMPVALGREMWGEHKKLGAVEFQVNGKQVTASCERNGTKLMELTAEVGDDLGPKEFPSSRLELKTFISADGQSLEYDPIVVAIDVLDSCTTVREGTAKLELAGTREDPVDTIPILSVNACRYVAGKQSATTAGRETLHDEDPEEYLPYVFGQHYDALPMVPAAVPSAAV